MKISPCSVLLLPLLAGCLSSAPKAPTNWAIGWDRASLKVTPSDRPVFGPVRITSVEVRAPYNGTRLVVLRPDGSVAFDAFNAFAASPGLLVKGALADAAKASGLFEEVVTVGSGAHANHQLEACVRELALDCRTAGRRVARVALTVTLLDGRNIVTCRHAAGEAEAGDDFSAAFSTACACALRDAFDNLPRK